MGFLGNTCCSYWLAVISLVWTRGHCHYVWRLQTMLSFQSRPNFVLCLLICPLTPWNLSLQATDQHKSSFLLWTSAGETQSVLSPEDTEGQENSASSYQRPRHPQDVVQLFSVSLWNTMAHPSAAKKPVTGPLHVCSISCKSLYTQVSLFSSMPVLICFLLFPEFYERMRILLRSLLPRKSAWDSWNNTDCRTKTRKTHRSHIKGWVWGLGRENVWILVMKRAKYNEPPLVSGLWKVQSHHFELKKRDRLLQPQGEIVSGPLTFIIILSWFLIFCNTLEIEIMF